MLSLSLHAALVNHDLRAASALAPKLDLDAITLAARSPAADLTELSGTAAREVRHILSSAGVRLAAMDHSLSVNGFTPRGDVEREIESVDEVLRAAVELGRPTVCVDLILLPPPVAAAESKKSVTAEQAGAILIPTLEPSVAPPPSTPRDPAFEASADEALREVGRRADKLGVVVAFRASLAPMMSIAQTLKRVDCHWFGVDLDPVALLSDEADEHAIFSALGPQVRHVRARDAVRGTGHRTRPAAIGKGSVDFAAHFANLDAAGYRGVVTIDSSSDSTNLAGAIQALRVRMR